MTTTLTLDPAARERVAARLGRDHPEAEHDYHRLRDVPERGRGVVGHVDHVDLSVELVVMLRAIAPSVFCIPPKPLAVGIHKQIEALVAGDFTAADVRKALRVWCRWKPYRAALIAGAPRYALDGTVAGEVSAEHAAEVTA